MSYGTIREWFSQPVGDRVVPPQQRQLKRVSAFCVPPAKIEYPVSLTHTGLTTNPGFNGTGNTNLLAAGNTLAVGATGKLTLTLNVNSGGHQGPYTNQVQGSATSPGNTTVTSTSNPTLFTLLLNPEEIPTLGAWGLLALALLLGGLAVWRLRRRVEG